MSACVSPPHESVSQMVHPAASIAAAASTALPPFWNIIAPAVALSGLPVIASQCFAWSGGFCVLIGGSGHSVFCWARSAAGAQSSSAARTERARSIDRPPNGDGETTVVRAR